MFSMTRPFGFAGERKAFALLILGFYMAFFGLISLVAYVNQEPAWARCFLALLLCYGTGFFALASGWFWGRWFAVGLGYSGISTALWGMVTMKQIEPTLLVYGLTHGVIALFLQGEKLIAQFDAQPGWQKRFGLDEESVYRIRKTVIKAVSSLPTMILFALPPRGQNALMASSSSFAWALIPCFFLGLYGILNSRTWGVFLLLSIASAIAGLAMGSDPLWMSKNVLFGHSSSFEFLSFHGFWILPTALLVTAVIPFARPVLRYLHRLPRSA